MTKVNLDIIKPWINKKVTEMLGFEDDVVIGFVFNQLEERVSLPAAGNFIKIQLLVYVSILFTYLNICFNGYINLVINNTVFG